MIVVGIPKYLEMYTTDFVTAKIKNINVLYFLKIYTNYT